MLSYNGDFDSPSLDIDLPQAVTADNIDQLTQPVSNQNASSQFNFGDAVNGVLKLLDNGYQIYNDVNTKIAQQKAVKEQQKTVVTVSPSNPTVLFGLNTNQLLLIAAGLAAVLVVPRLLRK